MLYKNIITVLLCLWATSSFAQNLKGTVRSKSGEAIRYATVSVLNSSTKAVADSEGNFSLVLSSGKYQFKISALGYATKVQQVVIGNQILDVAVVLSDESQSLEEVVVTADKVESNMQKTPIAVTVLNAKKMEEYRVWNITDITALAPSAFTIEHGNSSGSNFLNFRGAMGFTTEQAVATYVDGVYQFDFYSAPLNFNNIERIEILRGPQGTLYGRNSFSGVLNVVTKNPTNNTSGYASVDLGNYEQQRYSLGFNTPLVEDKLFMDVALQLNKRGSIYENGTLNTKDFDSRKALSGNFGLKYLFSDKWTMGLNVRSEGNTDKGAYPWVTSKSIALEQPYQAFGNYDNTEKRSNVNTSMSINYFGEKFNFSSITAGINFEIWFPGKFDYDFTADKLISGQNATKSKQFTQEFRFSSPASDSRLKWTVGSYLFAEKTTTVYNTFYEEDYTLYDSTAPYTTITNGLRNNKGAAFYGQTTYEFTTKLDVTFGVRYDVEDRALTQNSSLVKDDVKTILSDDTEVDKTFNAFTPKLILNYKINENSILYSSYTKGFRIGGFNFNNTNNPIFDPEKSDNYEVGSKNNLFNNKLKLNLTAFYFQQKDQQVTTSSDGVNYATLNVGNMNNLGIEAEVVAIPIKNLQVEWTASTSNSKYKKLELFDNITFTVKDYKGNKAIYNPNFQSMLAVQYNIPFTKSKQNIIAFIRGEYRYLGEYQLNFENTESQEGYGMINTRVGVTSKKVDLAFWVRNLNDARYLAWGYGSYLLGSPRMLGVTLSTKF
ncbi:TonB-dependent receptor [Flavobacterium algicola]|uniref:TonB-dependent receptor n=1 Tax=Flavobacterium algicola TaxID=556529 RepID=UPI001EFDE1C8|nr:TonB-dependent receptor [Flavobacterium algicola]MCG9791003.1 TonB-dependent receptor [Flavobacterium algicola]